MSDGTNQYRRLAVDLFDNVPDEFLDMAIDLVKDVVRIERERCANIVLTLEPENDYDLRKMFAVWIRGGHDVENAHIVSERLADDLET